MAESENAPSAPGTGGVDIGPIGSLVGTIPGLRALTTAAADVVPAVGLKYMQRRKAAKDYNDNPTDTTQGADGGQALKTAAEEA
jgi:hypothetical protein